MKKLLFLSLILLVCASLSLFAGGEKEKGAEALKEPIKLEFLLEGAPNDTEAKLFDEFDAVYPNIKLDQIIFPGDPKDYQTKILTVMAAGEAPDLFTTAENQTFRYVLDKLIQPAPQDLVAYIKKEAPPAMKDALLYSLSVKGEIYGAPWTADWVCLFWNKDIFSEVGLSRAPKTIPEMTEYAKKLTKYDASGNITRSGISLRYTGHPAGIVAKWISFFSAYGGVIVNDSVTKATFNDDAGKGAAQYYLDVLYKHKVDAVDIPNDYRAFGNKQTAMFERGPWVVPWFQNNAPDMVYGENYDIAICPNYKAKSESIGYIDAIVVPRGAKHPKQAWDFIKWLTMDEKRFARLMISRGSVPLLMSAANDPYYQGEGRFMKIFMDQPVWREPHHKHFYEFSTKLGGYLERIFYKKMGIDEAFDKAEKESNEILARTY
jgi:ABC-type glycerol-3-phosphate transport system substrate-binding protein